MIADLHAHYPMRVVSTEPDSAVRGMAAVGGRPRKRDKLRALILKVAAALFSNRTWWSGYRIDPEKLLDGDVRLAMSVLYCAFEEIDLSEPYAAPPRAEYFGQLLRDLEDVETEVGTHDPAAIRIARDRTQLDDALNGEATALVHCVEGGFHLGESKCAIRANVAELAGKGVVYVTLAHLFFRQVATNAPALPFLTDWGYRLLFPQPKGAGLTELGIAAVEAMAENRIMVDISHMDADSIAETFAVLDRVDPGCEVPVIATHAGYRFPSLFTQRYMLDEETILAIKRRHGVIGLIMAQHQLRSGVRRLPTWKFEQSYKVIRRHIDKIAEITGGHEHVALGTDFDGFIKPTMSGLETMADMPKLERALERDYGADAELLTSGNALRVLRRLWPA